MLETFRKAFQIKDIRKKIGYCRKGDMLITMGAGDVYKIGEKLVSK